MSSDLSSDKPKHRCCNNSALCWLLLAFSVAIIFAGLFHWMHCIQDWPAPQAPVPVWDKKLEKWQLPDEKGEFNFGNDRFKPGRKVGYLEH